MIISMSAELMATIIGTTVTIVALAATILYSNKTLKQGQENTMCLLEKLTKIAESTHELQKDMAKCLLKIAFWGKNTLRALSCDVKEDIELEEAKSMANCLTTMIN